jgi:hypothetical protein
MSEAGRAGVAGAGIVRSLLAVMGLVALAWSFSVIPPFRSEVTVVDVARAVLAGERFKPDVLAAIETQADVERVPGLRPSVLSRSAIIRLRLAEIAMAGNEAQLKQKRLGSLGRIVDSALSNVPGDSFLWLARFWLASVRDGAAADNLPSLRRSYELGPNEGWIGAKRDAVATGMFSELPADLADQSLSEFASLVRSGFISAATDIAARAPVPLRRQLFARLAELDNDHRGVFARAFYARELDEVPVPGFPPPIPHMQLPILPPDL